MRMKILQRGVNAYRKLVVMRDTTLVHVIMVGLNTIKRIYVNFLKKNETKQNKNMNKNSQFDVNYNFFSLNFISLQLKL